MMDPRFLPIPPARVANTVGRSIDGSALPSAGAALSAAVARPSRRVDGAWLAAAGVALLKLIKSAKFVKFALFVASLGALALNRPIEAACAIIYAIFVHESGHVLAMKACGIKTSGMYFLPFLGAVAVSKEPARTRGQEWLIAIAGPGFGLVSLLPLLAALMLTGDRRWAFYAALTAFINLFNLLPIGILDGGRIVQALALSIAGWAGIAAFALGLGLGAWVVMHTAGGVVSLILVLSIIEFVSAWRRNRTNPIPRMRWPALLGGMAAYLSLLVLFVFAFDYLSAAAKGVGAG
jgi:Zn-dependent protease